MSTQTEITRLQTARNKLRDKGVQLGINTGTDKLDAIADAFDEIVNQGAISAQVQEGDTYTIPAGYHNGSGTVSGVAGGGSYNLQSKPGIVPTKKQQSITPDSGYYGLSDVTVAPIPDNYQDVTPVTADAPDVLANKIIVDKGGNPVAGTMPNNGAVSKALDATAGNQEFTVPKGYHDGTGKVMITLEEKTTTPTKSAQTITPTTGKVLSKVSVGAIPAEYQDVTPVTAGAPDVLEGKTIVAADGTPVPGSMPNKGAVNLTMDGLTTTTVDIPAGYHNGSGKVSLTNDIEAALAAI